MSNQMPHDPLQGHSHHPYTRAARICATGSYLPKRILTNSDLERMVDTSDVWITSRTGIQERRIADVDEYTSTMGAHAGAEALARAQLHPEKIDLLIVATMTPDQPAPSTATLIQQQLGLTRATAFDLHAACSGYLYALSVAKAYIESGMAHHVLLIGSDKMSSIIDYTDRKTCVLFGDGATAAVISGEGSGWLIKHLTLGTDGSLAHLSGVKAGGCRLPATQQTLQEKQHFFYMEGPEIFKHAVQRMHHAITTCLDATSTPPSAIEWLIPHQANYRILSALAKRCDIPTEKLFMTIEKYGNTGTSSIGLAFDACMQQHTPYAGEHVLLATFGIGVSWGASVLTFIPSNQERDA